jgi:hypothetical protein
MRQAETIRDETENVSRWPKKRGATRPVAPLLIT